MKNLLLILFVIIHWLLIISCNLKSPQQDNMIRGKPFSKAFSNFIRFKKLEGSSSTPKGINRTLTFGDMIYKLEHSGIGGVREVINLMQLVVCNLIIGFEQGYRAYSVDEFRNLLSDLGYDRVKEIVKVHLEIFKLLSEVELAIKDVEKFRSEYEFGMKFYSIILDYSLDLKKRFSSTNVDEIYNQVTAYDKVHKSRLNKLKEDIDDALDLDGKGLHKTLSDNERAIIGYLKRIVTDLSIGDNDCRTYLPDDFNLLLVKLGDLRVKEILEHFADILNPIFAIENIFYDMNRRKVLDLQARFASLIEHDPNDNPVLGLQVRFDSLMREYKLILKKLFSLSEPDDVYANIMSYDFHNSKYADEFNKLKVDLIWGVEFDKLYSNLSSDEVVEFDSIRNLVTDSSFESQYKEYFHNAFYKLLSDLGALSFYKIVRLCLDFIGKQKERQVIIDNIENTIAREVLQNSLDFCSKTYLFFLKNSFNAADSQGVYDSLTSDEQIAEFEKYLAGVDKKIAEFLKFIKIYKDLSAEELEALRFMLKVSNGINNIESNDHVGSDDTVFIWLNNSYLREVMRIMHISCRFLEEIKKFKEAFNNISTESLKENFRIEFDHCYNDYATNLREALYTVYTDIFYSVDYIGKITELRNRVLNVLKGETLEGALKSRLVEFQDEAIYGRFISVLTNPIDMENSKTYSLEEFYILLSQLGAAKLDEIINHLLSVSTKTVDNNSPSEYDLRLKEAFSYPTVDEIYEAAMSL
ncbi:BTA121 domain-containing protein surface lipoprotein [Borrelia coriaceae]|nr:hypothetical protein [Borrelia coriaceae]